MNKMLKIVLALSALAAVTQAGAQITFYENDGFQGRSFTTQQQVGDFGRFGFNDRASSVVVQSNRWEVCENAGYGGRCVVLRQGRYGSLASMGLNDRVSSARTVSQNARIDDDRHAPMPAPYYDAHRRNNERLYQANVDTVRAVVGPPEQRCWIEHEQVVQERGSANVPGGIAGAVIGGILGHQIGGGSGRDLATIGGAVAGAAIGANVGRSGAQQVTTQDVQRCATVPSDRRPDFWDVGYTFRGQEHHVQMTAPPGPTVTVNRQGEPRA
ncbi:MAG TPA: beta/gamma crystallin-related protein [Burkholderiaceae bacterium]